MEFDLYGVAAPVVVFALMEGLKKAFPELRDVWAFRATVILGVVLAVGRQLATSYAAWDVWYQVLLSGLLAALTAAGLYSGVKVRQQE